jgi:hypothetical protein
VDQPAYGPGALAVGHVQLIAVQRAGRVAQLLRQPRNGVERAQATLEAVPKMKEPPLWGGSGNEE